MGLFLGLSCSSTIFLLLLLCLSFLLFVFRTRQQSGRPENQRFDRSYLRVENEIELTLIEKSLNEEFRSLPVWRDFFSMNSIPQTPTTPRAVRGMGPAIIVILIIAAALLGYYQIVYYPSVASNTTSTTSSVQVTPYFGNVTILPGAPSAARALTYFPNVATVYLGYNSTVVWTNDDAAEHTVTANSTDQSIDPAFYSWSQPTAYNNILSKGTPGDTLNFTFTVAGTYGYYCKYHPNMIGTIIVKPAPAGLTTHTTQAASTSSTITSTTSAILGGIGFSYFVNEVTVFAKSLATLTGSGIAP